MLLGALGCVLASRKKWRNPYVTDGLIAMWDGIWNAGPDRHAEYVSQWINLVDKNCYATPGKFAGTSNPHFDDNSAVFSKNMFTIANSSQLSSAKYVDILFKADAANNNNSSYICEFAFAGITFQAKGAACLKNGIGNGATLRTTLAKDTPWLFSVDFSTLTASVPYVNGNAAAYSRSGTFGGLSHNSFGRGYWNNHYFIGHIYCIRLYNRALTSAEIAANYAVDKARFNLP